MPKGYTTLYPIGGRGSQTFEFRKRATPTAIVAFRDVGQKVDYARPNRLWIEGMDLVFNRYYDLHNSGRKLPPAFAVVIDNIRGVHVIVPVREILQLYLKRREKPHPANSRQYTFVVEVRGSGYFLVMPDDAPARPLPDVNSFAPILAVL